MPRRQFFTIVFMASISSLEFIQSGEGRLPVLVGSSPVLSDQPFLRVLDQSLLPHEIAYIDCALKEDVFNVIRTMKVCIKQNTFQRAQRQSLNTV